MKRVPLEELSARFSVFYWMYRHEDDQLPQFVSVSIATSGKKFLAFVGRRETEPVENFKECIFVQVEHPPCPAP